MKIPPRPRVIIRRCSTYDVERIRADFPILGLEINWHPLVYLDNAASSQMPRQVIDRLQQKLNRLETECRRAQEHLASLKKSRSFHS